MEKLQDSYQRVPATKGLLGVLEPLSINLQGRVVPKITIEGKTRLHLDSKKHYYLLHENNIQYILYQEEWPKEISIYLTRADHTKYSLPEFRERTREI